jgi:hypothetical protein
MVMSGEEFGQSILKKTHESNKRTFSKKAVKKRNKSFNDEVNEAFSQEHMNDFGDWSKNQGELAGENIADAKNQIKKSSAALNKQMDGFLYPIIIIGGLLAAAMVYDELRK